MHEQNTIQRWIATKRFIQSPAPLNRYIRRLKLSKSEYPLYSLLYDEAHYRPNYSICIALKDLANELDIDLSTVRRAMKGLEDKGLVKRRRTAGICVTELTFPSHLRQFVDNAPDRKSVTQGDRPGVSLTVTQGDKSVQGVCRSSLSPRVTNSWQSNPVRTPGSVPVTQGDSSESSCAAAQGDSQDHALKSGALSPRVTKRTRHHIMHDDDKCSVTQGDNIHRDQRNVRLSPRVKDMVHCQDQPFNKQSVTQGDRAVSLNRNSSCPISSSTTNPNHSQTSASLQSVTQGDRSFVELNLASPSPRVTGQSQFIHTGAARQSVTQGDSSAHSKAAHPKPAGIADQPTTSIDWPAKKTSVTQGDNIVPKHISKSPIGGSSNTSPITDTVSETRPSTNEVHRGSVDRDHINAYTHSSRSGTQGKGDDDGKTGCKPNNKSLYELLLKAGRNKDLSALSDYVEAPLKDPDSFDSGKGRGTWGSVRLTQTEWTSAAAQQCRDKTELKSWEPTSPDTCDELVGIHDVERMIRFKGNNTRRNLDDLIPEVLFSIHEGAQQSRPAKQALRAAGNLIAKGTWRTPYGYHESRFGKCA